MKKIVNISLGSAVDNFDKEVKVLNQTFRIKRFGVDFDFDLIKKLIEKYKNEVDVFTLTGFPPETKVNGKEHTHHQLEEVKKAAFPVTVIEGKMHRDLYQPWFIHRLITNEPEVFEGKRVGFFSGCIQRNIIKDLDRINCTFSFADPYFFYKIPTLITRPKSLELFLSVNLKFLKKMKLRKMKLRDFSLPAIRHIPRFKDFFTSDIFIINSGQLDYIKLPDLRGKVVLIDHLTEANEEKLKLSGVERIISVVSSDSSLRMFNLTILEAIFSLSKKENGLNSFISFLSELGISPDIEVVERPSNKDDIDNFSFIVHPLSIRDIFRHPILKPFGGSKKIKKISEKLLVFAPGVYYGSIKGIKSDSTGKEIHGDLYTLFDTPKMMMNSDKDKVYKKLVDITRKAKDKGSKIIGLGAYTKIVGDAGVTVAKRSSIPVTTGNSLSATATLWAASYTIKKLGFVKKDNNKYQGTAIIVGATGSIGKVCSKVLSEFWTNIILVAPKTFKLEDLKNEILEISPECNVSYTDNCDDFLAKGDLIITTTSAQGRKILDINKIKPGSVVCDVSRPFDISLKDSLKRRDILVIASGEVELPGDVEISCDIGLPGNTVYACLAETALLTLEGRFESFSLSREINYKNVIEIDKIARKHGVRLSAIMGHDVEITDDEIDLCRQHALNAKSIQ